MSGIPVLTDADDFTGTSIDPTIYPRFSWPRATIAHQKTEAGKVFPVTRCAPSRVPLGDNWDLPLWHVLAEMGGQVSPDHSV